MPCRARPLLAVLLVPLLAAAHASGALAGNASEAAAALQRGVDAVAGGELDAAAQQFGEAISQAAGTNDPGLLARAHLNAGRLAWQRRQADVAATHVRAAVALLATLPPSADTAMLLTNAATALRLDETRDGQAFWDRSLTLEALQAANAMAGRVGDARGRSYARGYLAELYLGDGRAAEALLKVDGALFDAQSLSAPELLYRWHWTRAKALRALAREGEALDEYRSALGHLADVRGALPPAPSGASAFQTVLAPLYAEYTDLLLTGAAAAGATDAQATLLIETVDALEAFKSAELQDYFLDDCVVAAQERASAGRVRDDGAAVLYPVLLSDRVELILQHGGRSQRFAAPVGAARIAAAARDLRRALQDPGSARYLAPAAQLYDWLIAPLAQVLEADDVGTLVVVPDGVLRTIPFAALHDGKRFLVERFAIATTPGLSLTELAPLTESVRVLISGLSEAVGPFPPLPAVDGELDSMTRLLGPQRTRVLRNETFTSERLERELAETPYGVVHIASHGVFRGAAKDSFVLAWDGPVTIDRLERLMGYGRFSDQQVELLTLSACETAVGDDRAALGLSGVAIKAGARSAVGSLWQVGDEATATMIGAFYERLIEPGTTRAQALQGAQREMIASQRHAHPWAWSPFLLIGSWL